MRNTNFLKFMFLCCNNYIYPGYPRGGTKIEQIRSGKTHYFELTLSVRGGKCGNSFDSRRKVVILMMNMLKFLLFVDYLCIL